MWTLNDDCLHQVVTNLCYTDASSLAMACSRVLALCRTILTHPGLMSAFTRSPSLLHSAMPSCIPQDALHHAVFHGDIRVVHELYYVYSLRLSRRAVFHGNALFLYTCISLCDFQDFQMPCDMLFEGAIDRTLCTPLHIAVIRQWTEICKFLLNVAPELVQIPIVDPSVGKYHGAMPLHLACILDSTVIADILLQNGANPTSRNEIGVVPIHCARSPDMIETLLEHGARLNDRTDDPTGDVDGCHHLVHYAAENGFVNVLRHICDHYKADLTATTTHLYQAIHCAASSGHRSVLEFLTASGAPLDVRNAEDWTAVHCACHGGHLDVVAYLDSLGCDMLAPDHVGWRPVHIAIAGGWTDVVSYYLNRGVEVTRVDGCTQTCQFVGMTAIHLACLSQSSTLVGMLLSRKLCSINEWDAFHLSALHYAASVGAVHLIDDLLKAGADRYAVDSFGFGVAHYAQLCLLQNKDQQTQRLGCQKIIQDFAAKMDTAATE